MCGSYLDVELLEGHAKLFAEGLEEELLRGMQPAYEVRPSAISAFEGLESYLDPGGEPPACLGLAAPAWAHAQVRVYLGVSHAVLDLKRLNRAGVDELTSPQELLPRAWRVHFLGVARGI